MNVVDGVVGSERLAAMKVMYDRVAAAQPQRPAPPPDPSARSTTPSAATTAEAVLAQLMAVVLANAGLTATEKAGLLLELAQQAPIQPPREAALSRLRLIDSPPPT